MILVDPRDGNDKRHQRSKETVSIIRRIGHEAELHHLSYADFAFQGNGPGRSVTIGVELKTLHDMLHNVDDAHYSASQKIGMTKLYDASFLLLEGIFKPHEQGWLMEGFNAGTSWGFCRYRSQQTLYAKLRRYLFSVSLSGVHVMYTRDIFQTCYDVCELFAYFSKRWDSHTSMLQVQKLSLPGMDIKPPLVRRWAADLEGIGTKLSIEAEQVFRTPIRLASADEIEWCRVEGVGPKTAIDVVKQIRGRR